MAILFTFQDLSSKNWGIGHSTKQEAQNGQGQEYKLTLLIRLDRNDPSI